MDAMIEYDVLHGNRWRSMNCVQEARQLVTISIVLGNYRLRFTLSNVLQYRKRDCDLQRVLFYRVYQKLQKQC